MNKNWCFDGSGGCANCAAATCNYPYNPGRPHPNCSCSIKEIVIDEICTLIDKYTIEMVLDTMTFDLGPGDNPDTRRVTECENILSVTEQTWKCCKVKNGKVTDDCYENVTTKEEYILKCTAPYEVAVEETFIEC